MGVGLEFFHNYLVREMFDKWKWVVRFSKICNRGPPFYSVRKGIYQVWFSCKFRKVPEVCIFSGQEFVVMCGHSCALERFAVM